MGSLLMVLSIMDPAVQEYVGRHAGVVQCQSGRWRSCSESVKVVWS